MLAAYLSFAVAVAIVVCHVFYVVWLVNRLDETPSDHRDTARQPKESPAKASGSPATMAPLKA